MSEREKTLSIFGHLGELRMRLIRSVIAVAVTSLISLIFYQRIFDFLIFPAQGIDLIYIDLTEMMGTIMRVCLFSGVVLAMPYLTYEIIMFVTPALTRREKTYVLLILPWIALMFLGGVAFSYFILVPRAVGFLLTFGSEIATPQIKIGSYINIVTRLLLAVGLVFELPVVTTFLARIGLLKPEWLARRWREAVIVAFLIAAIITPTIDPYNQLLIAAPLMVLYFMSYGLAKLVHKRRKAGEEQVPAV